MSNFVERGRKCEVVGWTGWGYYGNERERDYKSIGRAMGREFGAAGRAGVGLACIVRLYSNSSS